MTELTEILNAFGIEGSAAPHGNGHINRTYYVDCQPPVIVQRINTNVFKKPVEVMENIFAVTSFLREKIEAAGGDPRRETLNFLCTKDGQPYYKTAEGDYYRAYYYVGDALSLERVDRLSDFAEAAHGFGKFQNMLSDFPAEKLYETIEKFHDTPNRYLDFKAALEADRAGRAASVRAEIEFALACEKYADTITSCIADGSVPLRVTHNDTKLNNVLLDAATGKALCVIDLDTVMPGSLLYDFGDALRFGASTGAEDEVDLDKIHFDLEKFEVYTEAFLAEVGDRLTAKERELLPVSALMMTLECGIRFLGDHLNGDVYFGIHRENHNLDRARTQFKLVSEIEKYLPRMAEIVAKY